jgi:hypothetical protein
MTHRSLGVGGYGLWEPRACPWGSIGFKDSRGKRVQVESKKNPGPLEPLNPYPLGPWAPILTAFFPADASAEMIFVHLKEGRFFLLTLLDAQVTTGMKGASFG